MQETDQVGIDGEPTFAQYRGIVINHPPHTVEICQEMRQSNQ